MKSKSILQVLIWTSVVFFISNSHDHHLLANAALAPYEQPLASQNRENLSAQPSVTSIHQVWTSASSNSADEFSPEMIGKLRKGLPFLAAYAVRPRLVGMSSLESPLVSSPLIGGSTVRFVDKTSFSEPLVGSSSARALKKLNKNSNNFDEFKVETSSTSRAEHRHNQKTILKKHKKNQRNKNAIKKRKSNLGAAVVNKFRPNQSKKRQNSNKKQHKHIPTKLISSRVGYFNNHKHSLSGRQSHRRASTSRKAVNWLKNKRMKYKLARQIDAGQVKGGTKGDSSGSRKDLPFYATKSDEGSTNKDVDHNDGNGEDDIKTAVRGDKDVKGNNSNNEDEDDDQDTDDEGKSSTLPRRPLGKDNTDDQGTDYEDEEDETVTIMPKFDGVDDNPDPNDYSDGKIDNFENSGVDEQGESSHNNNENDAKNIGKDRGSSGSEGVNENEGVDNSENSVDSNNGVTNSNERGSNGHSIVEDSDQGIHNSIDRKHNSSEKTVPGVEFADEKQRSDQGMSKDINSSNEARPLDDSNDHDDSDDIDNSKSDEMGPFERNSTISDIEDSNHLPQDGNPNQPKSSSTDDDDGSTHTDDNTESVLDSDRGSVEKKYNKDHEIDCENHDHHHNSMKWLQDAIKGEPEVDYPIMSKPLNNTSFSCRDQQYPGYYADVESRCQLFHVCQQDGRHSSLLCPNGTIFSQITTSCVWWDTFDCKDAPRYYSNNAQLYKPQYNIPNYDSKTNLGGTKTSSPMNNLIMSMKRKLNNDNDDDNSSQQKSDELDDVSDNNSNEMGHLTRLQERSKKVIIRDPKSRLQMKKQKKFSVRLDRFI